MCVRLRRAAWDQGALVWISCWKNEVHSLVFRGKEPTDVIGDVEQSLTNN